MAISDQLWRPSFPRSTRYRLLDSTKVERAECGSSVKWIFRVAFAGGDGGELADDVLYSDGGAFVGRSDQRDGAKFGREQNVTAALLG
ncbi:hypothetical protein D3C78_1671650 [compost metagenome]